MTRHLFVFQLPEAVAFVLAWSETEARAIMRRNFYDKCPVETFPLIPFLGGAA